MITVLVFISLFVFTLVICTVVIKKYKSQLEKNNINNNVNNYTILVGFVLLDITKLSFSISHMQKIKIKLEELNGGVDVKENLRNHYAKRLSDILLISLLFFLFASIIWLQDYANLLFGYDGVQHFILEGNINNDSTWFIGVLGIDILLLYSVAITLFWIIIDKDIDLKVLKRRRQLQYEFPSFLIKLVLMINSGVNLSSAWKRIVDSKKNTLLHIELRKTVKEIESGMSEQKAFELFANRCRVLEITKFVSILIQNRRKGSTELVQLLSLLARECWEIRKNNSIKLGEEASTKLIIPMTIILIGILIIVITPAILALNGL